MVKCSVRVSIACFGACLSLLMGCGADAPPGGGSFAIAARWQQRQGSQSVEFPCPVPPATPVDSFDASLPLPVVNTVRVRLTSPTFSCCVDLEGHTPSGPHSVRILNVPQGDVAATVSAYLENPGGGDQLESLCDTNGVGGACTSGPTTLTYTSDPTTVAVVPGATVVAQALVHSVPFLLSTFLADGENTMLSPARSPTPGESAFLGGPVLAAIVDAASPVCNPQFNVTQGTLADTVTNPVASRCSDNAADDLPQCSLGGALNVQGLILTDGLPRALQPGGAEIEFMATNSAGATFATSYPFDVALRPTATATPSDTPTATPTRTHTPVPTPSATASPTPTASLTPTASPTPTPSVTPTDTRRLPATPTAPPTFVPTGILSS